MCLSYEQERKSPQERLQITTTNYEKKSKKRFFKNTSRELFRCLIEVYFKEIKPRGLRNKCNILKVPLKLVTNVREP